MDLTEAINVRPLIFIEAIDEPVQEKNRFIASTQSKYLTLDLQRFLVVRASCPAEGIVRVDHIDLLNRHGVFLHGLIFF